MSFTKPVSVVCDRNSHTNLISVVCYIHLPYLYCIAGSGGRAVECRIVNRGDGGSIPPTAVSKLRQFRPRHICLCLFEVTLKASGPFYLVSMSGAVKDPTQGGNV